MKRREIKFMVGLLICTSLLTGIEVNTARINKQYKAQLEQYNRKLDEKVKLEEAQQDNLKKASERIIQLQKELDKQLNRVQELQNSLKQMSVKTDISSDIYNYIVKVANENGYRPEMLLGIIQTESNWQPRLVSTTNDYGLCQINEVNIREYKSKIIAKYGDFDVFEPHMNIDMMVMNLNEFRGMYTNKFNSAPTESSLLLAYNSGRLRQNFDGNTYTNKVLNNTCEYKKVVDIKNEVSNLQQRISRDYAIAH